MSANRSDSAPGAALADPQTPGEHIHRLAVRLAYPHLWRAGRPGDLRVTYSNGSTTSRDLTTLFAQGWTPDSLGRLADVVAATAPALRRRARPTIVAETDDRCTHVFLTVTRVFGDGVRRVNTLRPAVERAHATLGARPADHAPPQPSVPVYAPWLTAWLEWDHVGTVPRLTYNDDRLLKDIEVGLNGQRYSDLTGDAVRVMAPWANAFPGVQSLAPLALQAGMTLDDFAATLRESGIPPHFCLTAPPDHLADHPHPSIDVLRTNLRTLAALTA